MADAREGAARAASLRIGVPAVSYTAGTPEPPFSQEVTVIRRRDR